MKSHKCAALTMVWKSYLILEKWIDYYGNEFGYENLFVISHGSDQKITDICKNVNLIIVPREFSLDFDDARWAALSQMTSSLANFYSAIICGDCDELVVVNNNLDKSLNDYILQNIGYDALQPVGYNLVPNNKGRRISSLDWKKPLSEQCDEMSESVEYSKPCIVYGQVEFGAGGHYLKSGTQKLDPNLALFHLKYLDIEKWREPATQLQSEIKNNVRNGQNPKKIGTFWRKGFRTSSGFSTKLVKAKWIKCNDYHDLVYTNMKTAKYDSETRRAQRRKPTRGSIPERFLRKF